MLCSVCARGQSFVSKEEESQDDDHDHDRGAFYDRGGERTLMEKSSTELPPAVRAPSTASGRVGVPSSAAMRACNRAICRSCSSSCPRCSSTLPCAIACVNRISDRGVGGGGGVNQSVSQKKKKEEKGSVGMRRAQSSLGHIDTALWRRDRRCVWRVPSSFSLVLLSRARIACHGTGSFETIGRLRL
jgi:hypothetical protein